MANKQKRPVEGVLFDWDGTLINSYHADASAYLAMFKAMGIRWGVKEFEKNYSPNWYHVYRAAGLPRKSWEEADRLWRAHYAKYQPKLISGARRVLTQLGDAHPLGLVTSGDRPRKKPHPEPLRMALRQMKLDPSVCVYVGDAAQDVEMAQRAGVRAIGVLGPFPTEKSLRAAQPEFLLESIDELPGVLKQLRG